MNKFIRYFIFIYKLIFSINWENNSVKILINERKPDRVKIIKDMLKEKLNFSYQMKIPKNKIEFIILSEDADIIYSYGLNRFVNPKNLKLYYHGIVGDMIRNEFKFKIVSPPNFASEYIADYIFASVLAFEKKLLQNAYLRNNKKWDQKEYLTKPLRKLNDLKIGILGLGQIGRNTAKRFLSLGCKVYAFDIKLQLDIDKRITITNDWKSFLADIDYLIIAVSDIGNEKLLDEEVFSFMNKNICIVNISRMNVLDENQLIYALKTKKIRGAILDVFSKEPLPINSIYYKLSNVVVTPHIAGNIDLVFNHIANHFAENVKLVYNV